MDVEVRQLNPGEEEAFVRSVRVPFLDPSTADAESVRRDRRRAQSLETDRCWVAEAEGRFVGNACNYSLDLTLPAGPGQEAPVLDFAGVSAVGVHPTHRRRGLLRQLMARILDDARNRGEPVAGLIASESIIYGRFGFGHATSSADLRLESDRAAFARPAPEVDIRLVDAVEAASVLPLLYERQRRARAGEPCRPPGAWDHYLEDAPPRRHGANGLFFAVCEGGYAAYRVVEADVLRGERCHVIIEELRAAHPDIEAALWRFVLDLDLVGSVTARRRPLDEPLRWRLADPRQLQTESVDDRLWIRVLDVPAALAARGYRREGRLVLDVLPAADRLDGQADAAAGRWTLEAGPDGASCRAARPGEDADLRLGVADLGSLYLGGFRASELAAAGRVEELTPGSLDRADALMAATPAPVTVSGF